VGISYPSSRVQMSRVINYIDHTNAIIHSAAKGSLAWETHKPKWTYWSAVPHGSQVTSITIGFMIRQSEHLIQRAFNCTHSVIADLYVRVNSSHIILTPASCC